MTPPTPPTFTVGAAITWLAVTAAVFAGWALYAMRRGRR